MKTYQHKRTGGQYFIVADAELQCSWIGRDRCNMVIYQSIDPTKQQFYVRPKEEFFDGRFIEINPDDKIAG